MQYGWFLASAFTMLVVLSMAEICSAFPTSGGLYYWSAKQNGHLLPPGLLDGKQTQMFLSQHHNQNTLL